MFLYLAISGTMALAQLDVDPSLTDREDICQDTLPPGCTLPSNFKTCSDMISGLYDGAAVCEEQLAENPLCGESHSGIPVTTPGKIKDYCKVSCDNCDENSCRDTTPWKDRYRQTCEEYETYGL